MKSEEKTAVKVYVDSGVAARFFEVEKWQAEMARVYPSMKPLDLGGMLEKIMRAEITKVDKIPPPPGIKKSQAVSSQGPLHVDGNAGSNAGAPNGPV